MRMVSRTLLCLVGFSALNGEALAAGAHSVDEHVEPLLFWAGGASVDGSDGRWLDERAGALVNWDAFAWYGGDEAKLRLEAEGEAVDGEIESSELRALVSWNVGTFWDLQAGVRHDFAPDPLTWAVLGVQGLSPYFFETEARLFVSENADFGFRFSQSIELQFTQQLILEPRVEVNLFAQDVADLGVGAGLSDVEASLQLRYEVTRQVAPYLEFVYQRDVGETALITRDIGGDVENATLRVGLRVRL